LSGPSVEPNSDVVANWLFARANPSKNPELIHETDSGFTQSAQTKELKNGWFIEIGDHQERLIQKARELLNAVVSAM